MTETTTPACDCMTEDPGDGEGERVLMHSLSCPLHPEYDPPKRGTVTTLYYAGRRVATDGKLGHKFINTANEPSFFTPKKALHLAIGTAYEVEEPTPGTYRLFGAQALRNLPPHMDTQTWRVEDQSATAEFEAIKAKAKAEKAAKEENKDIGDMTLEELRRLFSKALPDQKAAMATVVMRYLRPY